MTGNQLKAQELEVKKDELKEKKRTGKAERFSKFAKGGADVIKSIVGVANDPSWYNLDKQLVNDVAQIPFGKPMGIPERLDSSGVSTGFNPGSRTDEVPNTMAFPGVMSLGFTPTIGADKSESSSINVAARNIYAYVRHANSGHTNYDAPDLMQYLLTMDGIYTFLVHAARAYSVALTAKSENRYFPKAILRACGFNPNGTDSIVNHLAEFRAKLNQAIQKVNIFNIPAKFPFYSRHMWMASNIFKDSNYHRSRLYVFKPNGIYLAPDSTGKMIHARTWIPSTDASGNTIYTPSNTAERTGITGVIDMRSNTGLNFSDFITIVDGVLDPLTNNEDFGIMSGDILKAYGEGGLFVLNQIGEDYHVETIYSPEVLTQISGCNPAYGIYDGAQILQDPTNNVIYQSTNGISGSGVHALSDVAGIQVAYKMSGSYTTAAQIPENRINVINQYKDAVSPDDNMVATRLMHTSYFDFSGYITYTPIGGSATNEYNLYSKVVAVGSELVDNIMIITLNADGTYRTPSYSGLYIAPGALQRSQIYLDTKLLNYFEWCPHIKLANLNTSGGNALTVYDNLEVENYAVLHEEVLDRMHTVALLSLFAVPLNGKTARSY